MFYGIIVPMTKKDNIIQFPTPETVTQKQAEEMIALASDECNGLSQHLCDVLVEEIIETSDYFSDANFFDEKEQESRDIYVVTNLINAMLLRHIEIPHELQRSLDKLYVKIKQMAQLPTTEFEIDFGEDEVEFIPDFDLNPEEDDD